MTQCCTRQIDKANLSCLFDVHRDTLKQSLKILKAPCEPAKYTTVSNAVPFRNQSLGKFHNFVTLCIGARQKAKIT